MELEILKKTENPLLSRTKVDFSLEFDGKPTPSKEEVVKGVAEKLKAKPEVVQVTEVHTGFGKGSGSATALIYDSPEDLKKLEPQKKSKKEGSEDKADKPKEDKADAKEAPKEEKADAPKEEKKEDAKAKEEPKEEKK